MNKMSDKYKELLEKYEDEHTSFRMSADLVEPSNPYGGFRVVSIRVDKKDKMYGAWTSIKTEYFNEENLTKIINYFNDLKNENKLNEIEEGFADVSKTFVESIIEGNNK